MNYKRDRCTHYRCFRETDDVISGKPNPGIFILNKITTLAICKENVLVNMEHNIHFD